MTRVYCVRHAQGRGYYRRHCDALRRAGQLAAILPQSCIIEVQILTFQTCVSRQQMIDWLHGKGPKSRRNGKAMPVPFRSEMITLSTRAGELIGNLKPQRWDAQFIPMLVREGLYHD